MLFEHSPQSIEKYQLTGRYLDYQYIRFLEDFFDILPAVSCIMPNDLYELIDTDEKRNLLHEKITDLYTDNPSGEWTEEDDRYDQEPCPRHGKG